MSLFSYYKVVKIRKIYKQHGLFSDKMTLSNEEIEKRKDKLNLKPAVDFVKFHEDTYETALENLLGLTPSPEAQKWAEGIVFEGERDMATTHVPPYMARQILMRAPKPIILLSGLEKVSYYCKVPVPLFDDTGSFTGKADWVPLNDFPRKNDHPTRVLVGISDGKTIYPTPIPESVSTDTRAIFLYHIHVLLHEFFHTAELQRRDPESRSKVIMKIGGKRTSFQKWWEAFEKLAISGEEPRSVSDYAATYDDLLNRETYEGNHDAFTYALAEQVCESFVAYMLGIAPNKENWTTFQEESFGNYKRLNSYSQRKCKSANGKWGLMDLLCNAELIS